MVFNLEAKSMTVKVKALVDVITRNRSKRLAASSIIEANPADLPVIPKLIADKENVRNVTDDNMQINRAALETIYNRISSVRANNKNIIELFPDIELAIQILVSSILSPKKMTSINLNYRFKKTFSLNPIAAAGVLERVREYIEENYTLEGMQSDIVREALFTSGACVYAIVPEAAVDEIVNADILPSYGMEEYCARVDKILAAVTEPVNLLNIQTRAPKPLSERPTATELTEYLASESYLRITDNMNILSYSEVKERITSTVVRHAMRGGNKISAESLQKVDYLDIFRNRSSGGIKQVQQIKRKEETYRKSLGKPMVTKLPTESVFPVFVPGNEKNPVGFFVLLDENSKPLSSNMNHGDYTRLDSTLHKGTSQLTPVQKAYNNLVSNASADIDINSLFEMYKGVLERQLYSTVKSTLYGKSINIAEKNDIYFLMFSRALQDQKTSILYLPKEQVIYYAFQYNEMGIGKSLLENLAVQSSMRAILLFAKVMAYAKQSIDVTKVKVTFDPNDPDPEKTIEQVQSSVLKLRQNFLPLGINNPVDLVNWIQRAGLQFSYENNPRIPNVGIEFENANITHTLPSNELEEDLRKQSILALGLQPETIDNSFSPDFARTVVNNNILLSKRVSLYQEKLNKDNTKFVTTVLYNDEDIRRELRKTLLENLDHIQESLTEEEKQHLNKDKASFLDYYLDRIADNIFIELPKPEDSDIENLSQEFDKYKENLDKVMDSIISDEIFSEDVAGELSAHMGTIRNLKRHQLLRQWCVDNNFYPELLDIIRPEGEEIDGLIESITQHLTMTMRNGDKILRAMKNIKNATDADLKKTFDGEDPQGADGGDTSGESSSSDNDNNDNTSDEDNDGADDLGGDPEEMLNF